MKGIALLLLVSLALVACTAQNSTTGTTATGQDTATLATGNVVEVNMTAENFTFSPAVINAKKGDRVIIHIVQSDKSHGLAIDGYNAHVEFDGGTYGSDAPTLDFIADKTGTFTFYCNVPCGRGHRNMKGTLVVA